MTRKVCNDCKNYNLVRGLRIYTCSECGDKVSNYAGTSTTLCVTCSTKLNKCEACGKDLLE